MKSNIIITTFLLTFILLIPSHSYSAPAGAGTGSGAAPTSPSTNPPVPVQPLKALEDTAAGAGLKAGKAEDQTLQALLGRVLGAALALLGIVFMGLTIFAGISWMLARGNSSEVEKARDTLTNSIIGLIIVIIAYAITQFIIQLFTPS